MELLKYQNGDYANPDEVVNDPIASGEHSEHQNILLSVAESQEIA